VVDGDGDSGVRPAEPIASLSLGTDLGLGMARHVIGAPAPTLAGHAFKPVILFGRAVSKADDTRVRRDLSRLPALLEYADTPIEDGTIRGDVPNEPTCRSSRPSGC
jgi:hypothetical protein